MTADSSSPTTRSGEPRTAASPPRKLVLASASPRRQQLLRDAGYTFVLDASNVDEDDYPPDTLPGELASALSKRKARSVAARHPNDVVLAADTVVAFGDRVIGKPEDPAHAREIIQLLGGTTQVVITAIAIVIDSQNYLRMARAMSTVRMKSLSPLELENYLHSGRWRGKAGGYGLQDGEPIVTRVGGCKSNVIGLPMKKVAQLLSEVGIRPQGK